MLTLRRRSVSAVALACALLAGCGSSGPPQGGYGVGQTRSFTSANPPPLRSAQLQDPAAATTGAPTITGISPTSGTPGTLVTITGTGFGTLNDVQIGGVSLVNVEYLPTQIVGTLGQGAAGPADVVVLAPTGDAVLPAGFTYTGVSGAATPGTITTATGVPGVPALSGPAVGSTLPGPTTGTTPATGTPAAAPTIPGLPPALAGGPP